MITYSCDNYLDIRSNSTTCEKQVLKKYKQLNFHPLNEIKSSIYQGRTSLLPSLVIQITGQYCDACITKMLECSNRSTKKFSAACCSAAIADAV